MRDLIIILILFVFAISSFGQNSSVEQEAIKELNRRGLDEVEVRKRLEEKGINLYSIDPSNPQDVIKARKVLDQIIKEMEEEKEVEKNKTSSAPTTTTLENLNKDDSKLITKQSEEVSEAIEDGSSLEEAISETLIDNQNDLQSKAKIYGQEIFRTQSIKLYRQSKDVKPPNSYILGVGDVVGITLWGNSEESQVHTINEDGYIKPESIPRIYLKGIKYGEAKELLRNKFRNYYNFRQDQFEISLNFSRTINISVVGDVFNFGSFNIPAINTAFNALVAAGGPSDIGSVRLIKLIRPGEQPKIIDVYQYLQNPDIQSNFYLEENDIIFVPPAEKVVSISGAVKQPFSYELLPNENLRSLLKFAKGLTPNAVKKNIQILRYENDEEEIIDVNWAEIENSRSDFELKAGDRIKVEEITKEVSNYVRIKGAVDIEGIYALTPNERLSDLAAKVNFLEGALLSLVYIQRLNEDQKTISYIPINLEEVINNPNSASNIVLQNRDKLTIYSKSKFVDSSSFTITGAVRNSGQFPYDSGKTIRISDAIFLAGGKTIDAADFAFVQRIDSTNLKLSQYIRVNLDQIDNNLSSAENILLKPNDVLTIYSKLQFIDSLFVSISGEVRNPGRFNYHESLSLKDVILFGGGLKFEASSSRIDIFRLNISDDKSSKIIAASINLNENDNSEIDNFQLHPFDEIYVRRAPNFELPRHVEIQGEVKYPGKYVLVNDNQRFSDIIKNAGGLTNEAFVEGISVFRQKGVGYIISDYGDAIDDNFSFNDIIIHEGDKVIVPKQENLVSIRGAIRANENYKKEIAQTGKINVPFEKGKNALYYIKKYGGGMTEDADEMSTVVIDLSGKTKSTSRFLFWKNYPEVEKGSTIFINKKPIEEVKEENEESNVDWEEVVSNTITSATSILTLLLLINRLD